MEKLYQEKSRKLDQVVQPVLAVAPMQASPDVDMKGEEEVSPDVHGQHWNFIIWAWLCVVTAV